MLRKIGLLVLAVALLIPAGAMADYAHKLEAEDMTVSWSLDGDNIKFELSAKTTGWVAIGIDPEKAMLGADIIIGAVKKGKFKIQDHYADKKRAHKTDKKLGGTDNVQDKGGSETDGVTTISFSRPLAAAEEYDKPIKADGITRIMIAYGTGRDSFKTGHKYRAVYDVNFATGEAEKVK